MSKTNGHVAQITGFDFSHLYKKETVDICGLFSVTVREIPHGDYAKLQKNMLGNVHLSTSQHEINNQIRQKTLDVTDFQDRRMLMAIDSWTLTNADGTPVDVTMEAWHALPHSLTEQIEKAVKGLNPTLDEDFQGESGSTGTAKGDV